MPICCACGKYIPEKDPIPQSKTFEEMIDTFNSIGCGSFIFCTECIKKYLIKEDAN